MAAERDTVDRLIAAFLADRVGAVFDGRITGVTRFGLFVRLAETGADGFVADVHARRRVLPLTRSRHALVGERTGESFRLGDSVEVRLVEATPVAGGLRFAMVSSGRKGAPAGRRKRR